MSAGKFQRIYPKTGRLLFDGGKNSKFERSIILDNESPDCANVVFTNGAVETRQGVSKLNTVAIGSFPIDGLYTRRANDQSETMIAFAGGSAWQLGATTFTTIASAQSVFTQGVRVAGALFQNHLFSGNGNVIPYKWNGSAWTRHGVYPPTSTHTAATGASGGLSGIYQYKITWVNSALVESDVGPANSTITVASTKIDLSSIPIAPQSYGISARRIYRTANSGIVFKRVTELSDNTATTYSDNTADTALGVDAPTDHGVPPKYSIIRYHANRLFVNDTTNGNQVAYSDLDEPYTFGALNFVTAGDNTSDLVKSISVYDNNILIGCEKSFWMIYMPSSDDSEWKVVKIKGNYGTRSPHCVLNYQNEQLFPAVESTKFVGFASIAGNSVEPQATLLTVQSTGSEQVSDRIEPDMFNVQEGFLGNISGIVFKNKAWITLTYGSGTSVNNRIYQMDFSISNLSKTQKQAWVPFTGLNAAQFCIFDGNLYFGTSQSTGFVYKAESGTYNDDGTAIDSYYWTKEFSGFDPDVNNNKDFRYANLLVEKTGAYYMDLGYRVDSDTGSGTSQQVSLDPGSALWGTMVWGIDMWGGGVAQQNFKLELGALSGKRIQFKFSNQNTVNQRFKVHYMNFTYNLKGQR